MSGNGEPIDFCGADDQNEPQSRALASTLVSAAATAATTAYSAYTQAQSFRYPIAVSLCVKQCGECVEKFSIVVPPDKTVRWLCEQAGDRFKSARQVDQLAYVGNEVLLNRDDLVYDACRMLNPAKPEEMLVVVPDDMQSPKLAHNDSKK